MQAWVPPSHTVHICTSSRSDAYTGISIRKTYFNSSKYSRPATYMGVMLWGSCLKSKPHMVKTHQVQWRMELLKSFPPKPCNFLNLLLHVWSWMCTSSMWASCGPTAQNSSSHTKICIILNDTTWATGINVRRWKPRKASSCLQQEKCAFEALPDL